MGRSGNHDFLFRRGDPPNGRTPWLEIETNVRTKERLSVSVVNRLYNMAHPSIEKGVNPVKQSVQDEKNQHLEDILELSGGFGRFQVCQLVISLVSSVLCSFNHLGAIFFSFSPRFQCQLQPSLPAPLDQSPILPEVGGNCVHDIKHLEIDQTSWHSIIKQHLRTSLDKQSCGARLWLLEIHWEVD